MENKTLSRALFGVTVVLFIITFYFFYGMITNGQPDSYDPEQMGLEMLSEKVEGVNKTNYLDKGEAAFNAQIKKIDSNIKAGVTYMGFILIVAGIIMVVFLIWGLVTTLMTDFKKGLPSLIFSGIAILAFIFAFAMQGKMGGDMQKANFWVNGLLFVLIPGAIILLVDLILGIVRGYTK